MLRNHGQGSGNTMPSYCRGKRWACENEFCPFRQRREGFFLGENRGFRGFRDRTKRRRSGLPPSVASENRENRRFTYDPKSFTALPFRASDSWRNSRPRASPLGFRVSPHSGNAVKDFSSVKTGDFWDFEIAQNDAGQACPHPLRLKTAKIGDLHTTQNPSRRCHSGLRSTPAKVGTTNSYIFSTTSIPSNSRPFWIVRAVKSQRSRRLWRSWSLGARRTWHCSKKIE